MTTTSTPQHIRLLKTLAGFGVLAVILLVIDLRVLVDTFLQISLRDIGILALLSLLLITVSVVKWRAFLARLHISASFTRLFRLYLVGYFINLFTPSFIGGDVVRSLYVGKGVDRTHSVSATFLERYTGVAAMLAMACGATLISHVVTPQIRLSVLIITLLFILGSWLVFSGVLIALCERHSLSDSIQRGLRKVQSALTWGLNDRRLLVRAVLLSFLFHLLTVVNTIAVAHAIGWDGVPWEGLLVVVPIILIVGAIPVSPQGLGIQEGAWAFFLGSVGATTEQAIAIALVLRAKSYLLALCGGLLSLGLAGTLQEPIDTKRQ